MSRVEFMTPNLYSKEVVKSFTFIVHNKKTTNGEILIREIFIVLTVIVTPTFLLLFWPKDFCDFNEWFRC